MIRIFLNTTLTTHTLIKGLSHLEVTLGIHFSCMYFGLICNCRVHLILTAISSRLNNKFDSKPMLVRGTFLLRVQNKVSTRLLFVLKCVFSWRGRLDRARRERGKRSLAILLLARRGSLALSELSASRFLHIYIPHTNHSFSLSLFSVLAMHFFSLTEHMR